MITLTDIKKLKKVFVTKSDLKSEFKKQLKNYPTRDEVREMFHESSDHIVELFSITNKKIDEILDEIKGHTDDLGDLDRRVTKLEDKVFAT